ncbi:hypothetical protein D9619_009631 [Psilocybe cf. subviscida]|uniref:Uncharacterized protein n=1 Tax=Psilocybe cf. subviscida TaxID=2480587 RepID=A0A8H5F6A1_9AGAR|nr:hypothetical protein D9619_009631 [Psilocybe cf. subviscida]
MSNGTKFRIRIKKPDSGPTAENEGGGDHEDEEESDRDESESGEGLTEAENSRQRQIRERCGELQSVVDKFCEGNISQSRASRLLFDALEFDNYEEGDEEKEDLFDEYMGYIISHQASLDRAAERGKNRVMDGEGSKSGLKQHVGLAGGKRGSSLFEADSDGETGPTRFTKYAKLEYSDMPFYADEVAASAAQDPSCRKSQDLLMRFAATGISQIKQFVSLSCARDKPSFPSSQWERIIRGEAVDIDAVFSDLH